MPNFAEKLLLSMVCLFVSGFFKILGGENCGGRSGSVSLDSIKVEKMRFCNHPFCFN